MIMRPEAENCSLAMSMSTTVSCPRASWDTQAKKCRTINSYKRPSLPWHKRKEKENNHFRLPGASTRLWHKTAYLNTLSLRCCKHTCRVPLYFVGCMGGWAWSDFLPCRGLGPPGWSSTRWANVPQTGLCVCCSTRGLRARFGGKMFVSVRG